MGQVSTIKLGITKLSITDTCSTLSSSTCRPCDCYNQGSFSSLCDPEGQCMCKDKFNGRRCETKDCELTEWSQWAKCPCGRRVGTYRLRDIKSQPVGDGRKCGGLMRETKWCKVVKCDCKPGYYGNQCEKRDCVLHHWSAWSTCESCPKYRCDKFGHIFPKCKETKFPKKTRSRGIKITKVGDGIACSSRQSESNYCGYACSTQCRFPRTLSGPYCSYGRH